MARKKFTLSEVKNLDFGRVEGVFQTKLAEILADIDNRVGVAGAREISVAMKCTPEEPVGGRVETISMCFEIKTKVPGLRSRDYAMELTKSGLVFNDLSPDDPHQQTLDEELERNQRAD